MAPTLTMNPGNCVPTTDRRRRSRLAGETLGWILPAEPRLALHLPDEEESWEVRVFNVSRLGIGFSSTEAIPVGTEHRIRIGRDRPGERV